MVIIRHRTQWGRGKGSGRGRSKGRGALATTSSATKNQVKKYSKLPRTSANLWLI